MTARLFLLPCVLLILAGCRTVPPATPEEISIRDKWAALVPPAARRQVFDDADRHTDWGEKRKVRFEVEQFQRIVRGPATRKSHATQPTTTSRPTTRGAAE